MEESEASASSSAPKMKKPKINFSNVRHKFDTIQIFIPKLDKEVTGSKCKVYQQTIIKKNSSTLKKYLEALHPEIFKVVESLDKIAAQKVIDSTQAGASSSSSLTAADILIIPPRPGSSNSFTSELSRKRKPSNSKEDWSAEKQERANKFLALWLGCSTLPVLMVQDPNMARYVKAINPDADVPGRTKVQKDMETLSGKNLSKFQ